jgi:putative endonuclease
MSLFGFFGRKQLGATGEDVAAKHLKKLGMKVLDRNFKTDMGEIDIVAKDGDAVVFVEVKTRTKNDRGFPEEAVDRKKLRKIEATGRIYLRYHASPDARWRIDVIAVEPLNGELVVTRHIKGM